MSILDNETSLINNDSNVLNEYARKLMLKYPISEPGKDAFGNKLYEGDYVLYVAGSNDIEGNVLRLGRVKKVCPKLVTVITVKLRKHYHWSSPSYNGRGLPDSSIEEDEIIFKARTNRIIKININDIIK